MMETTAVCGIEAATRGLVEGSSSPPASVTPSPDTLGEFGGLINTCCTEEVRGETPGREDCRIDPLEGELDSSGNQNRDQNMFGGCFILNSKPFTGCLRLKIREKPILAQKSLFFFVI